MTINNTKHIVLTSTDIRTAIADYLFRTQQIEVERERVRLTHIQLNNGRFKYRAEIHIPVDSFVEVLI